MSDKLELLSSLAESGWAETMTMGTDETFDGSPTAVASDVLRWAAAEIERLRLTDAEREAVEAFAFDRPMDRTAAKRNAATLRGLLERTTVIPTDHRRDAVESVGDSATAAGESVETDIPPAWLQRPYWVDPPSGWRYGFPRLYDPSKDGKMTEWMIRHGYPERLARQGLPCTFSAMTEK